MRTEGAGGGIAIIPRNDCIIIDQHVSEYYIQIIIKLKNSQCAFLITSVYIPPASSKYFNSKYVDILNDMLDNAMSMKLRNKLLKVNMIYVGDFNAHLGTIKCGDSAFN